MAKFKLLARWIAFDGARPGDIVETDDPERIKHGLEIGFFEPVAAAPVAAPTMKHKGKGKSGR